MKIVCTVIECQTKTLENLITVIQIYEQIVADQDHTLRKKSYS